MTMQPDSGEVAALAKAIASLSVEIAAMRVLAQSGGLGDGSDAIDLIAVRVDDVIKRVNRVEARHEKLVTIAKDADAEVKRMVLQRDAVNVRLAESNSVRTSAAVAHAQQLGRTRLGVAAGSVVMCCHTGSCTLVVPGAAGGGHCGHRAHRAHADNGASVICAH